MIEDLDGDRAGSGCFLPTSVRADSLTIADLRSALRAAADIH